MPIYYTPASLILNQAKSMGYEPTFMGGDGMDGILAIEGFDTSLAEGLLLMTPLSTPPPLTSALPASSPSTRRATMRSPTSSPLTAMTASTPSTRPARRPVSPPT